MNNGFKERLMEYARKQHNVGMTNFEKITGITSGSISKIKDGLSSTNLAKIAEKCPDLNIRWLLTGSGAMIYDGDVINQNGGNGNIGKVVGEGNIATYYYGKDGEREKVEMEIRERQDERTDTTMNKMLNMISEMRNDSVARFIRIENELEERNRMHAKLLEMISEKDAIIKMFIEKTK